MITKPFVPEALTQGITRMLDASLEDRSRADQEAADAADEAAFG